MARVFICTLGGAPAVVTESLWALKHRAPAWVPDRIEVITTAFGLEKASTALQVSTGHLRTVFGEHKIPPISIMAPRQPDLPGAEAIEVPWPGGDASEPDETALADKVAALADIITEADANVMGDLIKDRVWHAASRGDEIHVSIAGGRKTMSAHALLALAIFGNRGDEASHVLIAPEFENNDQFWHPDQAGGPINTAAEILLARQRKAPRPPGRLDPRAAAASLRLIPTPTPLIAELSSDRKELAKLKMSEIMAQLDLANIFHRNPAVTLDTSTNSVTVCGQTRQFPIVPFLQLRLLATAMKEGWTCRWDHPADSPGWVTEPRLARVGNTLFTPLEDLSSWHQVAWKVAREDPENIVYRSAKAEYELLHSKHRKNGASEKTDEFLHDLPGAIEDARGAAKKAANERDIGAALLASASSWLKSTNKVRACCEAAFGKPLTNEMFLRREGRKGAKGGAWALNCPAEAIIIL